jgi:hypothetical protein
MDFDKALKEITDFLNVSEDMLLSQPIDLLGKMVDAVRGDDMFKVHSLGYSINSST